MNTTRLFLCVMMTVLVGSVSSLTASAQDCGCTAQSNVVHSHGAVYYQAAQPASFAAMPETCPGTDDAVPFPCADKLGYCRCRRNGGTVSSCAQLYCSPAGGGMMELSHSMAPLSSMAFGGQVVGHSACNACCPAPTAVNCCPTRCHRVRCPRLFRRWRCR